MYYLLKFYCKQKFVWVCYLVVFISTLFFVDGYLFYVFFLLLKERCSIPSKVVSLNLAHPV